MRFYKFENHTIFIICCKTNIQNVNIFPRTMQSDTKDEAWMSQGEGPVEGHISVTGFDDVKIFKPVGKLIYASQGQSLIWLQTTDTPLSASLKRRQSKKRLNYVHYSVLLENNVDLFKLVLKLLRQQD